MCAVNPQENNSDVLSAQNKFVSWLFYSDCSEKMNLGFFFNATFWFRILAVIFFFFLLLFLFAIKKLFMFYVHLKNWT